MDLIYPNEVRLFRIAITLATMFWLVLVVATLGIALIYILAFFIGALFAQAAFITHVKGSGVLVTEEQFPDLHAQLVRCCERVGVEERPDMYLLRTDFFNALATRFLRRHYVVLFSDVIDALVDRPESVNFYIGHELGHIHRNHIFWGWILSPALILPLLGNAFRRAEEYTCDRYGNACCETDEDATGALAAIVAGDTRWKSMKVPAYLKQVATTGGFWMSLNELTSQYPWLSKRMAWVISLRQGKAPGFPRRNPLAWLLATLIPSVPGGMVSLIMVIVIIGILAAVALPAYQDYVKTAELAQQQEESVPGESLAALAYEEHLTQENLERVLAEMSLVTGQVAKFYAEQGAYPTSLSQLGWESESLVSDHGGMPLGLYEDGVLAVYFGESEAGTVYFVNEPGVEENGSLQWYCYGQNIPIETLPESCQ